MNFQFLIKLKSIEINANASLTLLFCEAIMIYVLQRKEKC